MVPDRSCPQQDQGTTSTSSSGSPSLEEPGMVPGSLGDVDGLPLPHSSTRELAAERTGPQGDGHSASTSCLACLREKYQSDSLSTEASELMLASWGMKTSQTYDSLFRRWASWCSERSRNPISGPIADVVNSWPTCIRKGINPGS